MKVKDLYPLPMIKTYDGGEAIDNKGVALLSMIRIHKKMSQKEYIALHTNELVKRENRSPIC